jgi:hypothetical protein
MFFIVETCIDGRWIATKFILEGEFRKHLEFLNVARLEFPGMDFRVRRITPQTAKSLIGRGTLLYKAPNNNV